MTDIHIFNYNGTEDAGKAVQLYVDEKPVVILGDDATHHGQLVARMLTETGVPFTLTSLADNRKGAPLIGDRHRVAGAGAYIDMGGDIALMGVSEGYGIGPCPDHASDISSAQSEYGFQAA